MHDEAITILNGLIEITKDGEEGFKTAAEGLQDPQVKALFKEFSRERGEMRRQLQDEVRGLGGDPEKTGSWTGSAHRGWINIKSVVTGKDDGSIIAEAERGEDSAKATFEEALREPLPPATRSLVQHLSAAVHEVHDRVRALEQATTRR
jgi:uncharacterized protein (TIGR02284 family)